jgi:hypothetical protein
MDDDLGSGLHHHRFITHDVIHMRMGVDDVLDFIDTLQLRLRNEPLPIISRIDEQTLLCLFISDQIAKDRKISDLVLIDNHLLPPGGPDFLYYNS